MRYILFENSYVIGKNGILIIGKMLTKLKDHLTEMWKYFFTAIKFDREDKALAASSGVPVPNPNGNIKNWFKTFGFTLVVIIIALSVIWEIIFGKRRKKRSKFNHHGINVYGIKY